MTSVHNVAEAKINFPPPQVQEVFVQSGLPTYTFVQPIEYDRLLVALRTAGRSIVVEGPSGIGKTTAITNAIQSAGLSDKVLALSARKKEDVNLIRDLPNMLPFGIVLIDDFHRLDDAVKSEIADLMKTLADESASHSKVIVIGITNAGQSLISFGKDLAFRIEVIPFDSNPDFKVDELLRKGEETLNVDLNIREEIIVGAQGSFYLAQMLAYNACLRSKVLEARVVREGTHESYHAVVSHVMESLKRKFHEVAIAFARGTKLRPEGRAPYLHLLYWLSQSEGWTINAAREADHHVAQRGSVSQVVTKGYLADLIASSVAIQEVLHFDVASSTLISQDPQFVFYLRNLSWHGFAEEVGFLSIEFPTRYDFALSFAGEDRNIAEALFRSLVDHEVEVFYDVNEQHRILAEDVEEYLKPIYASEAQFVLCLLGPAYPKKIWTKFESEQFKARFKVGEVIPIVMSNAPLGVFDAANTVGHLSWDHSKDIATQVSGITEILLRKCGDRRNAVTGGIAISHIDIPK